MIKLMATAATHTQMVLTTKVTGRMTSNTGKVRNLGQTEPIMRVSIAMVSNTATESFPSLMVASTLVNSRRTKSLAMVNTYGQMRKSTRASGKRTKCMALAF